MKPKLRSSQRGESGLLDLFVIIIAVAAVALVGYGYINKTRPSGMKAQRINCANNLKQIGLSYRLWGGDNGDKYPSNVSTNAGGTMELVANGFAFPDFLVMSNELGTPKIIVCPEDKKRSYVAGFGMLKSDANVSYFTVPEADESLPDLWLAGDRNLATNRVPLNPGLFKMPTNRVMGWTSKIHNDQGYLVLADGSVQNPSSATLHRYATNALRAHFATTNTSFQLLIP